MNYWPGFVDALSTLILGIIFLLTVFVVVQFYLSQEVAGKDTALAPAQRADRAADRAAVAGKDRQGRRSRTSSRSCARRSPPPKASATATRACPTAPAPATPPRRARSASSPASSKPRSRSRAARWRRSRSSTSRSPRCAASSRALEQALDASEKKDKESQTPHRRPRPAAQRRAGAARAGAVALPLRLLRPAARDPRQPAGHPHRRRPLRVAVGGVLRHRQGRSSSPKAAPSSTSSPTRLLESGEADPAGDRLGAARRRPHRRAPDHRRRSSSRTGTCRPRARSRWCNI